MKSNYLCKFRINWCCHAHNSNTENLMSKYYRKHTFFFLEYWYWLKCWYKSTTQQIIGFCSSVLVTEWGKSSPKSECLKMMQTHFVLVTNSLTFRIKREVKDLGCSFKYILLYVDYVFSPSKKLNTPNCFVPLVNTTGEETFRVKHKQLNTVTCDGWKKKRLTPSQALPSS